MCTVQITAEVQQLIEETAAAFREYQETRAEVGRHLEAAQVSTDELARVLPPLPDLPDGPDEVFPERLCSRWTHRASCPPLSAPAVQLVRMCCASMGATSELQGLCLRAAFAFLSASQVTLWNAGAVQAAAGKGSRAGGRDGGRVRSTGGTRSCLPGCLHLSC